MAASLHVQIRIAGDKEEIAKLQKLGDKLTDFTGAMKTLGTELKGYYGERNGQPGQVFSSEGGVLGQRWDALSPVYFKWKGKHYPGKGILVASGRLMKGVRYKSNSTSVTIDNPTPYFEYLQLGGRRMPARPMLAINKDVEDIAQQVIDTDVKEKLAAM